MPCSSRLLKIIVMKWNKRSSWLIVVTHSSEKMPPWSRPWSRVLPNHDFYRNQMIELKLVLSSYLLQTYACYHVIWADDDLSKCLWCDLKTLFLEGMKHDKAITNLVWRLKVACTRLYDPFHGRSVTKLRENGPFPVSTHLRSLGFPCESIDGLTRLNMVQWMYALDGYLVMVS